MIKKINRRNFIRGSAMTATLAGIAMPFNILKAGFSPNEKLNLAFIGIGNRGRPNIHGCGKYLQEHVNFTAFCDIDDNVVKGKTQMYGKLPSPYDTYPNVPRFKDYRVMLEKLNKDIDAVFVTTPDHTHHSMGMSAMNLGKHVYIEKPLTHKINEARELAKTAKEKGLVTQLGNQGASGGGYPTLKMWYDAGLLGDITECHFWREFSLGEKKKPDNITPSKCMPKTKDKGAEQFSWNDWLNITPTQSYRSGCHPFKWRKINEFGSGALGDWACHFMGGPFYAFNMGSPISVYADISDWQYTDGFPKNAAITWEFAATDKRPAITFKYYKGNLFHQIPDFPDLEPKEKLVKKASALLFGTKCNTRSGQYGISFRPFPEAKTKDLMTQVNALNLKKPRGRRSDHYLNFILACKGKEESRSHFDYASKLTETALLGVIAMLNPGKKLLWDAQNMKFTNDDNANKMVSLQNPRDGWILTPYLK